MSRAQSPGNLIVSFQPRARPNTKPGAQHRLNSPDSIIVITSLSPSTFHGLYVFCNVFSICADVLMVPAPPSNMSTSCRGLVVCMVAVNPHRAFGWVRLMMRSRPWGDQKGCSIIGHFCGEASISMNFCRFDDTLTSIHLVLAWLLMLRCLMLSGTVHSHAQFRYTDVVVWVLSQIFREGIFIPMKAQHCVRG